EFDTKIASGNFEGWIKGPSQLLALAGLLGSNAYEKGTNNTPLEVLTTDIQDRVYEEIIRKYPHHCEAALYQRATLELRNRGFWTSIFEEAPRQMMKDYLKEALIRARERLKREEQLLEDVREVTDRRAHEIYSPVLNADVETLKQANVDPAVRTRAEKRLNLVKQKFEQSSFWKARQMKLEGIKWMIENIEGFVGSVGLMEKDFQFGKFLMSNGKAVNFVRQLAKRENQTWGQDHLQYFRIDRDLRVLYPIVMTERRKLMETFD
ncbi:unnamed protein product, partial [Amoebophrya sp. A120]